MHYYKIGRDCYTRSGSFLNKLKFLIKSSKYIRVFYNCMSALNQISLVAQVWNPGKTKNKGTLLRDYLGATVKVKQKFEYPFHQC